MNRKGSVLVLVLFVLCLLSAFCAQLGYGLRGKLHLVSRMQKRERLRLAAEGGAKTITAELAVMLETGSPDEFGFGYPARESDAGAVISHRYSDSFCGVDAYATAEEGRINVNLAGVEVLRALFENSAELDEDTAMDLACCVVDWRDANATYDNPQGGAEDKDYRGGAHPYEAADRKFQMLHELLLVKGMTMDIFEAVEDSITIYGSGAVDINSVSREVLLALGVTEDLADSIINFRFSKGPASGGSGFTEVATITEVLNAAEGLTSDQEAELRAMVDGGVFTVQAAFYRVRSMSEVKEGDAIAEILSVVTSDGQVLFWYEKQGISKEKRSQ